MLITNWIWGLFLTALISGALVGYGCLISLWVKSKALALLLGIGIYTNLILFTGLLGWYTAPLQGALLCVGWLFLFTYAPTTLVFSRRHKIGFTKTDFLWCALPFLYYLTRFFAAGLPQQHNDALYYHLLAPKLWAQWGQIKLVSQHPSFCQSTLWELLYGLPQLWLTGLQKGFDKNITTQLTGQWLHFFWGQVGSFAVAWVLVAKSTEKYKLNIGQQVFVAWLCTTVPAIEWTGGLAKNDYIFMVFLLGAFLAVLESNALVTGLLLGLAYDSKMFAVWAIASFVMLIPFKQWPRYFLGLILATTLLLFRNIYFTGNPAFPLLDHVLGPHWVHSGWAAHNGRFAGLPQFNLSMWGWLWDRMFEKNVSKILLGFSAVGLVFVFWSQKKRAPHLQSLLRQVVFLVLQIFFITLILKPGADGRYSSPTTSFLYLISLPAFLEMLLALTKKYKPLTRTGFSFLLLGLGLNIPLDALFKVPARYWLQPSTLYLEQFHPEHKLFAWFNANTKPLEKIFFLTEKANYYLDHDFDAVPEMRRWEYVLEAIPSAPELFKILRFVGYRYVHMAVDAHGVPQFHRDRPWLTKLKTSAPFASSTSVVFDLTKI